MNTHDYHFLLSERDTLNKLIDRISPSDVIGRMSLQVRLKEVEEGINSYEGAFQQLGEGCPIFQGRHVDYELDYAVPVGMPTQRKDKFTMQLSEPIEKTGFFWLPGEPKNQLPGVLRISESGKITLKISYSLNISEDITRKFPPGFPLEGLENRNLNRIVGIIDNDLITLDECFYKDGNTSLTGGVSTLTIYANRAFIGVNYGEKEKISFSEIRFSIDNLDEWLLVHGFRVKSNWKENGGLENISINFSPPEEISFNLPEEIELKFTFSWSWPSPNSTEVRINQKAYISLKSKELRPIEYFLDLVSKLHNFLCFAIDKTVSLDSVTGYSSEITQEIWEGKKDEIPIKVYYRSIPYSEIKPEIYWPDMLFSYKEIADEFGEILNKWIKNYEIHEPAFNLYFASVFSGQKYLEWKFLSLAQGIETLHRRSSQEMEMPDEEFIKIKENVLEVTPDEKQEWLAVRLKYANELSLRKRIKQMIKPFKDLFGNRRERDLFISKVVDTRNYLTHYDSGLETKAASKESLWELCMKLEALFQLHFLRLIGMNLESIKSIVNKNTVLRNKLGLEYQELSEESA